MWDIKAAFTGSYTLPKWSDSDFESIESGTIIKKYEGDVIYLKILYDYTDLESGKRIVG